MKEFINSIRIFLIYRAYKFMVIFERLANRGFALDIFSKKFQKNPYQTYLGIEGGFDGFCAFVQEFNDRFGIPRRLGEMGVSADRMDDLVAMAMSDPSCGGNPVPLTADNLRSLFGSCI